MIQCVVHYFVVYYIVFILLLLSAVSSRNRSARTESWPSLRLVHVRHKWGHQRIWRQIIRQTHSIYLSSGIHVYM